MSTDSAPPTMLIGDRLVGGDEPPYVIAEISANHNQSKAAAIELVHAAAETGADAVKLQHYTPETITVRSDHPDFQVRGGTLWDGTQLADLYAEAMTPWEWTEDLAAAAAEAGITWFSTPFDPSAADFLDAFDVPVYKIASFEIVDLPLIRYVASKGRPLIISTGMATVAEIDAAVAAARQGGAPGVTLLRCSSAYPAKVEEIGLRAIPVMSKMWSVPVGFSDHTLGAATAIAAVAMGASVIEKHLIRRRADGGPDAAFSAEPDEFTNMVTAVHDAHAALGPAGAVRFGPAPSEAASQAFRRSLRAVRPIAAGEVLTADNVRSVRPAGGLAPDFVDTVLGLTATQDLEQGAPLTWADVRPTT